jgi:DHA1 family multidrug resistance protein-like MFS transporter
MLRAVVRTYLEVFRLHPVLVPLATVIFCGEAGYAALNNFLLPLYLRERGALLGVTPGATGRAVGFVTAGFLLSETVLRIPMGRLSDRLGRRPLMVVGPLVSCLSPVFATTMRRWGNVVALRLGDGCGAAALWPSVYALIGDRVNTAYRATAMSVANTLYFAGVTIGPWAASTVVGVTGSYPAAFRSVGILFLGAAAASFWGMRAVLARQPAGETAQVSLDGEPARARSAAAPTLPHGTLVCMLAITFAQNFAIIMLAPFLSLYARVDLGVPVGQIGRLYLLPGLVLAFVAIPMGRLADAWPRARSVRIALFVSTAGMACVPLVRNLETLMALAIVLGAAYALGTGAWLAVITEIAPEKGRGATFGRFGTVQGLGAILAPLVGGHMWDMNHAYAFWLSAGVLGISTLIATFGLRDLPRALTTQSEETGGD